MDEQTLQPDAVTGYNEPNEQGRYGVHGGQYGSCHLINVQIFGRSAGTGGSCQT